MQNTRLNSLLDTIGARIEVIFQNPWRRLSFWALNFLFGFFLGTAIGTSTGQAARWDIVIAGLMTLVIELMSRIIYTNLRETRFSFLLNTLNSLKIGLTYGLFVEAFKLAS